MNLKEHINASIEEYGRLDKVLTELKEKIATSTSTATTRESILNQANSCVNGDRDEQYGSPEKSFGLIAALWSDYLVGKMDGVEPTFALITPKDVAAMMALFKIARIATGEPKLDNWIDLAGYAACGGEIESNEC